MVKIGKKIFKSKSQVVLQKKRFYEAENLSLDSSKSLKLLKWQIKFSDKDSLKLTFDWYKKFYKSKDKNGLLKMSLDQIKIFKQKHNIS